MPAALVSIGSLLAAVLLFEAGNSLLGVLLPYRGILEDFGNLALGGLGTAYYLGFVVGCLRAGQLIRRIGHIRAFAACAAVAASTVMVMGLLPLWPVWLLLRVGLGFCLAGMFMVVESWLNEVTSNSLRGRTLSSYMLAVWLGTGFGKALFSMTEPDRLAAFALVSIAISLALVPVAMTNGITPVAPAAVRLRLRPFYRTAPVAFVGCLVVGAANGAFWTLGPIYVIARSESVTAISLFMTVVVLGGALSQWPLGRLSDSGDRRWIIVAATLTAAASAIGLVLVQAGDWLLLVFALLFGGGALPVYSLCVAHANDHAETGAFVDVSGQLLLLFGLGAMLGPTLASLLIRDLGPASLFAFIAVGHLAICAFTLARMRVRAKVPVEARDAFLPLPRTTPQAAELDPRAGTASASDPSAPDATSATRP